VSGPLRRQGETHVPGALGMARAGHQVHQVNITVESLPDGGMRVTTPQARGWAATARNQEQLAHAVSMAFTEVSIASYARWKGEVYDLDELTDVDPGDPTTALPTTPRRRNRLIRSDAQHPGDWARVQDGRWRSPAGRFYKEDSQLVQRVIAKRRALGIPDS
jgi:hypothetical protein